MNVLERLVDEALTRVPDGPSAGELRRRARVRRARRIGSAGTVAIVLAAIAIAVTLQAPGSHKVQVSEPAPTTSSTTAGPIAITPTTANPLPLATTAEFPPLARIIASVAGSIESNTPKAVVDQPTAAEIVATTDTKATAIWGGTTDDKPIYVVQVRGTFVCEVCPRPQGAGAPHGVVLTVQFDTDGNAGGFGMAQQPTDLSRLGTVYRLELTPLATTQQFPALAAMTEIVAGNVRSDYRPTPGALQPASGEIVETTVGRAFALFGGSNANLDDHIYVVQVLGNFVCDSCSPPYPAVVPRNSLRVLFDASGKGYGFGEGEAVDLSTLGTVYRVVLPG